MITDGSGGISGSETTWLYGATEQASVFQGSDTVKSDGSGAMILAPAAVQLCDFRLQ